MSATIRRRRMVAIEFGTCRSVRIGGASGSVIGGKLKLRELRDAARRFPSIIEIFADAGYQGPKIVADTGN